MNHVGTMHTVARHLLPALLLAGLARTTDAQQVAEGAPPPRPPVSRNVTLSVAGVTGISPWLASGVEARAQLRLGRWLTAEGSLGGGVRTIDFDEATQRNATRGTAQAGLRVWPQGRALEGWGIGLAYGRSSHRAENGLVLGTGSLADRTTLSRVTLDVGHHWLVRSSKRIAAFANGAVSRNAAPPASAVLLAIPRTEVTVGVGVGVAF
jgi:hypothetical protein